MNKGWGLTILVPLAVVAAFVAVNLIPMYQTTELRVYDALLHVKPAVPENKSILLLDVDDLSISKEGSWPWSRDKMAKGLELLTEFGARAATFDILYEQTSPLAVNANILKQDIPQAFQNQFQSINQNVAGLFQAIANGQISMRDAKDYVKQLEGLTDQAKQQLLAQVDNVAQDNDLYLANAARMFGHAYFTVTPTDSKDAAVTAEQRQYTLDHFVLKNIDVKKDDSLIPKAVDIIPVIPAILQAAKDLGFPRVEVDKDGVRRRIFLLYRYNNVYFPQLIFGPLLDLLQNPQITATKNDIVLKNAVLPGSNTKSTIDIPLATDGSMLINWPPKTFNDSFHHLSYYNLLYHDQMLADLVHNLSAMQQAGYFSVWSGSTPLMQPYSDAEAVKQELFKNPTDQLRQTYRDDRKLFFQQIGEYLNGSAESDIQQQIDSVLATPNLAADQKSYYEGLKTDVTSFFGSTRDIYKKLMEVRGTLEKELPNAFIIIGWTSTSTTDIGVNPFDEKYVNVGTHASVFNTIIQQKFLDDTPWWIGIIIAALFSLLVSIVIRNMAGGPSIAVGATTTVFVLLGISVYFVFTGVYVNVLTPTISVAVTFIVLTIIKFLRVGREKAFLRNAFNHYLSPDVITQIVNDPNSLSLGGRRQELTALFTDVRGFSTISESMDPEDLVRLLNRYLGEMSDAILAERGTIDKYEGDAIISFFGAPINIGNHAVNACRSALKMKELEAILNKEFLETKVTPSPLLTRIGINTGEMVVGNMGTLNRMDYTMMGHNVNLAARLEGVNKQYGTWILVSEATYRATDRAFSIRRLDRVRVVGVSEPIRLYELIGERETVDKDPQIIEKLRLFNSGLNLFEEKKYEEAQGEFQKVVELYPDDGPTKYYLERCQAFRKKPPAPEWDGVFNLASK